MMKTKIFFTIAAASVSLILADSAKAQNDGADRVIEEIMVTATRKETSLMVTPIAVSAFDQKELDRQNITTVTQIAEIVPNLQIHESAVDSGTSFTLRGVTSNNNTELGDPSVALHVDGIYSPRPQGALALMYDLERLEVLRGPQGTLYGRNATGGSINVITAKPDFDSFYGDVAAEVGNHNQQQFRGTVNVPVSNSFALRANFFSETRDGWADQRMDDRDLSGDGIPDTDQRRNRNVGKDDYYTNADKYAYRLSALWLPTDALDLRLTYENFQDDSAGGINFQDCERFRDNCNTYGLNRDTVYVNVPGERDLSIENIRLNADWQFSDSVKAVFHYGNSVQERSQVFDDDSGRRPLPGSSVWTFNIPDFSDITQWQDVMQSHPLTKSESDSFELQLQGANGNFDWLVGYFNFKEDSDSTFTIEQPFCCTAPWLGSTVSISPNIESQSEAFFFNATWNLTDEWAINAGYRRTDDEKSIADSVSYDCYGGFNVDIDDGSNCSLSGGNIPLDGADFGVGFGGLNGWPSYTSADLQNGFFTGPENLDNYSLTSRGNFSDSWSQTDWRLGVDWNVTGDSLVYAFVATGYKAGGFSQATNFDGSSTVAGNEALFFSYDPEEVFNTEIGYKASLFDSRMRLGVNLFRTDYEDKQETAVRDLGVDPITGLDITALVTDNINNATLQGLEVDLNYLVGESGRLDISGAVLDTEIKKNDDYTEFWFCDERAATAYPCDPNASASGLELPFAPDWTLTVAYGHDFYLPGGGRITPWVQVHWESEAWMTSDNFDAIEQYSSARPSFSTVNATVGYYAEDDKWSLELFCSNCTDEWIRTFVIADSSGAFGGYRAPRYAGVRGQFNF